MSGSTTSRPMSPIQPQTLADDNDLGFDIFLSPQVEKYDGNRPPHSNARLARPTTEHTHRLLRRSSSNSGFDIISRYHDQSLNSTTLQKQLMVKTNSSGKPPIRPWRIRRVRTAPGPFRWTNPQSPGMPGFKWFPVRTTSDPSSSAQTTRKSKKTSNKDLPLKTCMKQKSKSTTTTSPNDQDMDSDDPRQNRKLRRVKTVDFEGSFRKKPLSLPPLQVWTGEDKKSRPSPTKTVPRVSACPGPKTKSSVADTAITQTDVHVVAVAPSWSNEDLPASEQGGIDPATPTMQIVESGNGCYEVVWDDVPSDHDIRFKRHKSSTSHALHTAGLVATCGLERVNTKLTEWSWARRGLKNETKSPSFKPQIVVFPDDDGRDSSPRFDCAVEEDEDLLIIAAPSSERASSNTARRPSQPASARMSRSASFEDTESDPEPEAEPKKRDSKQDSLAVPNPEATNNRPGRLIGISRGIRKPPAIRRLSNMDESEMHFRGHRDSVALARSRIFNAGGVSPQLFVHRDSVSMAKKRMHAKNHATSAAGDIPRSSLVASHPLSPIADLSQFSPSPPSLKKTNGMKSLKTAGVTSAASSTSGE
ncbi:hypothetical protein K469DRAFT_735898 [Zopfia rhizophila CBS 207.26]|uniref:Uncharacterized protein n=1 Tax=Zopfia rhizophila CBS 207.26 TaxID=1314779 RepID=A0A6A6ELK8_9PEZI|nr:hypothetical protein K469DRAFT_735898 [Zopfia rhizophila CBS 207.26]